MPSLHASGQNDTSPARPVLPRRIRSGARWTFALALSLACVSFPLSAGAEQVQPTPAKTSQAQAQQTQDGQQGLEGAAGTVYTASDFFADLKAGRVTGLTLEGDGSANVNFQDARPQFVVLPPDAQTLSTLRASGVPLKVLGGGSPFDWLSSVLPLVLAVLILAVLWRTMRGAQGGGGREQPALT